MFNHIPNLNPRSPKKNFNASLSNSVSTTRFLSDKQPSPSLPIMEQARTLHYPKDRVLGYLCNGIWNATTTSWPLYTLRFELLKNEKLLFTLSQLRANAVFWDAYHHVPAYRQYIGENIPKRFEDIRCMTKADYIKPYVQSAKIHNTFMYGKLPLTGQIDTSTGTSGQPTPWVRGMKEIKMIEKLSQYATRVVLGKKPFIFINAFALGPWATGMTVSNIMRNQSLVFSAGPDKEKIFNILKQFPPQHYPDFSYVIAGYPPFLKELAIEALNENINLDEYAITAIVGGEAISDATRQQAMGYNQEGIKIHPGFKTILPSYGASDLRIDIARQFDYEQALGEVCKNNQALANDLFGTNRSIPSIFHFDPLNFYIETNQEEKLIFTCLEPGGSPRIRYHSEDLGKVMPFSEVNRCLEKHQVKIRKPNTTLPLLFVWGRDGVLNYRSSKVAVTHLEEAISRLPILKNIIQNYAFNSIEVNGQQHVEFWLELKMNARTFSSEQIVKINHDLIKQICLLNQDFKFQIEKAPLSTLPRLRIFEFNDSPMSNQDPHRKKKYIYNEDVLLNPLKQKL